MSKVKKATFGAGCFWGVEDKFMKIEGVIETAVGFMGGRKENPSYEEVGSGKTGHTEVVRLNYNSEEVSYENLLKKFFEIHDPTQFNKQGPDVGSQYRSIIFYHNEEQKEIAEKMKNKLQESERFGARTIATAIEPAQTFWKAEEYHQKYIQRTGGKVC